MKIIAAHPREKMAKNPHQCKRTAPACVRLEDEEGAPLDGGEECGCPHAGPEVVHAVPEVHRRAVVHLGQVRRVQVPTPR